VITPAISHLSNGPHKGKQASLPAMVRQPLRFMRPTLPAPDKWLPYLEESYRSQWFSNFGPVHVRFSEALTERYGGDDRIALPVSNCTAGLTATLLTLGLRGQVAMPSFTFSAPAHAVVGAGCTPLFCDIDSDTWEMSGSSLDRLLTREKVVAVLHVRVFGLCRDLSPIEEVCRRHGVPLIVDAAAALGGAVASGPAIGHAGRFEVFSLHATKTFGIGEGGVVFGHPEDIEHLRRVINFGQDGSNISTLGLNGKLCEMHAAIGLAVLDDIDLRIATRAAVASFYKKELSGGPYGIRHASIPGQPAWSAYPIELSSRDALDRLQRSVASQIETRRYYFPSLHRSEAFAASVDLPVTNALDGRILCLPVYSDMTREESQDVCRALSASFEPLLQAPYPRGVEA
jgi:dTDP-4-amino-4,6-dideoxygalactose transaminase